MNVNVKHILHAWSVLMVFSIHI